MATTAPAVSKNAAKAAKKGKDGKKKGKAGLIILLAFIVVVLGAVLLTAFNVFGMRDDVVLPMLRNVPLVRNLIPEEFDEETLSLMQINEGLEETIRDLETRLAQIETANSGLAGDLELAERALVLNELEIARLREIEAGQMAFVSRRAAFEREVAEGNADAFVDWFDNMNPDLAERIYRSLMAARVDEEKWQNFVAVWGAMNPRDAAHAIETMVTTDMDMIVSVLGALPPRTAAAILGALTVESRAAVTRHMNP